ncbi:DUF2780 domain-containing protein [Thalassotalea atypica]|uniref:DUF2780 domain-containing protein n=1 Tax=Thalassotalea atypica TaxID=2054316 RepID=UPI002572E5A6|nr:DUF2780 domain-containing protein [Thalassotalea atypica]
MKKNIMLTSALLIALSTPVMSQSFDLNKSLSKAKDAVKSNTQSVDGLTSQLSATNLLSMASNTLGLSPETTEAGIGALLNAAKSNLSKDNFSMISGVLPDSDKFMSAAPKMDTSALTSMLGKSDDKAKATASLGYIDSAFKQLGIPKETIMPLTNMLTGYMEQNGYGQAAGLLKQGLSFL